MVVSHQLVTPITSLIAFMESGETSNKGLNIQCILGKFRASPSPTEISHTDAHTHTRTLLTQREDLLGVLVTHTSTGVVLNLWEKHTQISVDNCVRLHFHCEPVLVCMWSCLTCRTGSSFPTFITHTPATSCKTVLTLPMVTYTLCNMHKHR